MENTLAGTGSTASVHETVYSFSVVHVIVLEAGQLLTLKF